MKCNRSCSTFKDTSNKICVPSEIDDENVKTSLVKQNVNVNLIVRQLIQIENGIVISVDVNVKNH